MPTLATQRRGSLTKSDQVLDSLSNKSADDSFVQLLEASLSMAKASAQSNLKQDLYNALSWPTDYEGYLESVNQFSRWIPQQSSDPAWSKPGTSNSQEVYDRLCHFYFLIDQPVGPGGTIIIENIPWFADWLVEYARIWGSFLNTTESFSQEVLDTFLTDSPQYRVEDSLVNGRPNNPSGWLTFNQFFARELNPGLRPIASPVNNNVVTCPADCTFKAAYAIDANSNIPEIIVKQTHTYANIANLLQGSQFANSFANGNFVHYFLGPYSYHRFHTPVAGKVVECYAVPGLVYLDVNITNNQFDAPDSSGDGYEFVQMRGVITIDTTNSPYGNMGIVAVIPIGMCQVSSVNMIAQPGTELLKGDEFGYFLFGGSDIILLFQQGMSPMIDECTNYRHYGTTISKCPPQQ